MIYAIARAMPSNYERKKLDCEENMCVPSGNGKIGTLLSILNLKFQNSTKKALILKKKMRKDLTGIPDVCILIKCLCFSLGLTYYK